MNERLTKEALFENVRAYTPEEIAEALNAGIVILDELKTETEGAFTPLLKKRVLVALDKNIQDATSEERPALESSDINVHDEAYQKQSAAITKAEFIATWFAANYIW